MSGKFHSHWITASGHVGGEGANTAVFPYWSFTKTVIAAVALKLSETGTLELDASISGEPYTLRHLLAHTSGLPDYGQIPDYHAAVARQDPPWSRSELLRAAMSDGMLFPTGQGWAYSNIGYMFAREFIEATTGRSFAHLLQDLIATPLNLTSVRLAQTQEDMAQTYWSAAAFYDPAWVYHGCLIGTPKDAARLLHALMTGDVLAPHSLDQMLQRTDLGGAIPGRPWTTCGYGLGLMSGTTHDGRSIGHSGVGPFCVNAVYHFPDRHDPITVATFGDGSNEASVEHRVVALAL